LLGRGGGFRRTRARARWRPSWPSSEGETAGTALWCGAHVPARGGLKARTTTEGGGESTGVRPAVGIRDGSPPWVRFRGGEVVLLHGREQAITGVGPI
jgi:hypothetical protein